MYFRIFVIFTNISKGIFLKACISRHAQTFRTVGDNYANPRASVSDVFTVDPNISFKTKRKPCGFMRLCLDSYNNNPDAVRREKCGPKYTHINTRT
jgi:hypothetical protein